VFGTPVIPFDESCYASLHIYKRLIKAAFMASERNSQWHWQRVSADAKDESGIHFMPLIFGGEK
jgi:hypothetical protein